MVGVKDGDGKEEEGGGETLFVAPLPRERRDHVPASGMQERELGLPSSPVNSNINRLEPNQLNSCVIEAERHQSESRARGFNSVGLPLDICNSISFRFWVFRINTRAFVRLLMLEVTYVGLE